MDSSRPLHVLVLNASLKHAPKLSNTEELAQLVLNEMKKHFTIDATIVRLADKNIPVGLGYQESEDDEWPALVAQIKDADIVIFATPVWWGQRSSLLQRAIERMDAFDEEANTGGRSVLLNKVAGVVITGSEDGAQQTLASIMEVMTFMKFTFPPQCCAYWVGEVGKPSSEEREKRLASDATKDMAKTLAYNLVQMALLLREHPLREE
jgi:multimeric flavodoxin WrbA